MDSPQGLGVRNGKKRDKERETPLQSPVNFFPPVIVLDLALRFSEQGALSI